MLGAQGQEQLCFFVVANGSEAGEVEDIFLGGPDAAWPQGPCLWRRMVLWKIWMCGHVVWVEVLFQLLV